MSWFSKLSARPQMSYTEALQTFGFPSNSRPSPQEVSQKYRELLKTHHHDRETGSQQATARLQNAVEVLRSSQPSNAGSDYVDVTDAVKWYTNRRRSQSNEAPPWQTDPRSSYNEVRDERDFKDINACMKAIYEYSLKNGLLQKWTIMAFDGAFFRGQFNVFTNRQSLGYAGEVMEFWNSKGGNPYHTVAVFAKPYGNSDAIYLIREHGVDVSNRAEIFSPDGNAYNDQHFMNELRARYRK